MTETSKLINKCSKYQYVSFDIFDTLVLRNVSKPVDVFELTSMKVSNIFGESSAVNSAIKNFPEVRIRAEQSVRQKNSREITIDDIYDEIRREFPEASARSCDLYKQTEIEIELQVAMPNPDAFRAYCYCIESGKHIFITTDMYLPKHVIEQILCKCGYTKYDELFLSSEQGYTKKDGSIYKFITDKTGLDTKSIIHIGDNLTSDILRARLNGYNTAYIKKKKHQEFPSITKRTLEAFLSNSNNHTFGFQYFGPMLYGYVKWLSSEFRNRGYDKVLFFSREGFYIKKAFDLVNGDDSMPEMYFYASRRALQVPAMCLDNEFTKIIESMFLPYEFTVNWIIKHWGLDPEKHSSQIKKAGLTLEHKFNKNEAFQDKLLKSLFEELREDIINNSKNEYLGFINYLRKNDVHGRVAVVDIGWNGNMQRAFEKIAAAGEINIDVDGYYLGYLTKSQNYAKQRMHGYLNGENGTADYIVDYYCITAIELMFMAPHGTTVKYDGNGNAVLADFEYDGTDTKKRVESIQRNALMFLKEFKNIGDYLDNDSDIYSERFLNVFKRPSMDQARYIGDLQNWDGKWVPIAKPDKLSRYVFNKKSLRSDLIQCPWKIGFLKRMFKFSLPYYEALKEKRKKIASSK